MQPQAPFEYQSRRLTYRFNGRAYRLTDVAGDVIEAVLG